MGTFFKVCFEYRELKKEKGVEKYWHLIGIKKNLEKYQILTNVVFFLGGGVFSKQTEIKPENPHVHCIHANLKQFLASCKYW